MKKINNNNSKNKQKAKLQQLFVLSNCTAGPVSLDAAVHFCPGNYLANVNVS